MKKSEALLPALREAAEDVWEYDGERWGQVYLDNVKTDLSPRAFAGCLAQLERQGLYKSQGDDCFGDVRLA